MTSYNNDMYYRAPFNLIPASIIRDMKSRILFDEIVGKEMMFKLHGWTYNEIINFERTGDKDPLKKMFDEMDKHEPQCIITCAASESHFKDRKCFPIAKVYSELMKISVVVSILDNNETRDIVLKEIEKRLNAPNRFPLAHEFTKEKNDNHLLYNFLVKPKKLQWFKNIFRNKVNILIVDLISLDVENDTVNPESKTSSSKSALDDFTRNAFGNLVKNLNENFKCKVTPRKFDLQWERFLDNQFNNASFLAVVLTTSMIYSTNADSLNSVPPYCRTRKQIYYWDKIHLSQRPIVGIVFDETLQKDAENLIAPAFLLPKQMEFVLKFFNDFHD